MSRPGLGTGESLDYELSIVQIVSLSAEFGSRVSRAKKVQRNVNLLTGFYSVVMQRPCQLAPLSLSLSLWRANNTRFLSVVLTDFLRR
jgi:hypothetical protein